MGLAVLFSGQGTQHAAMLPWLDADPAAAPVLAQMRSILAADWRQQAAQADWLTQNRIAQPLLAGVQLAAWATLAPALPRPIAVAGYSVGELAAFAAAGALTPHEALSLAALRAEAMDQAMAGSEGGMAAVRDIPLDQIAAWCARHGLAIAIRLAPDRAIVGGAEAALAAALSDPAVAQARIDRIAVRIPSHTSWMAPAARVLAAHFVQHPLKRAALPLICNYTGAVASQPAELAACLAQQVASVVPWDSCMDAVAERGARCVLEIGPGSSLAAMWRERHPAIPVRSADEFKSAAAIAAWATRTLERAA